MFIKGEVQRLLSEGMIEPSPSLWRAEVVVTKYSNHKKRLVIDYSQTINKFTQLDAYPLPNMDDLINKISQFKVFTSVDLKSAFKAGGQLVQFTHVPFGATSGVNFFQSKNFYIS